MFNISNKPKQTNQNLKAITISIVLILIITIGYFFLYPLARIAYLEHEAGATIQTIESYKKKYGIYPASLEAAGVKDNEWLLYETSDNAYRLSFYSGMYWYINTYTSEDKHWHIED